MTRRRNAGAAAVAAGALFLALACRERGRPNPDIRMAVSHSTEPRASAPEGDGRAPRVPSRLEIPPEVAQLYSAVRLTWRDSSDGKEGLLEVPLGGMARIPGSPLDVRADAYLPAFTMSADAITSSGTAEENPAARISVSENGNELFSGWIFKRFPDVHPFQHARYSIRLEGGVRRSSA